MSGISSSVGLVSGLPTEDIINELMLIEALPLFRLQDRVIGLEAQRSAINDLLSSVLGIQTAIGQFGELSLFRSVLGLCVDLLSELKETNKFPTPPGDLSPQDAFRLFGADEWDELRGKYTKAPSASKAAAE